MNVSPDNKTLLISSEPLRWPHVVVEQRRYDAAMPAGAALGIDSHAMLIFHDAVDCRIEIEGMVYALGTAAPSSVVVPAGAVHSAAPLKPIEVTRLVLSADYVAEIGREFAGTQTVQICPFVGRSDPAIAGIAQLLIAVVTRQQHLDHTMLAQTIRELTIRFVQSHSDQAVVRHDMAGKLSIVSMARVFDLIARRVSENLTVDDMAREAGLSRAHFSRAFALSVGRSPHRYLVGRRVAKAAYLLGNSSLSLSEIASACGFHDQAHLSHAFKAHCGQTPRDYRQADAADRAVI